MLSVLAIFLLIGGTGLNGLKALDEILAGLNPDLAEGEYVFASFRGAHYADLAALSPIASFQENEGLTLVIERSVAEAAQVPFEGVFKMISLGVHSSLDAVGLTAAISGSLAECGISANVIAAYYHDHIFVQSSRAKEAVNILSNLK